MDTRWGVVKSSEWVGSSWTCIKGEPPPDMGRGVSLLGLLRIPSPCRFVGVSFECCPHKTWMDAPVGFHGSLSRKDRLHAAIRLLPHRGAAGLLGLPFPGRGHEHRSVSIDVASVVAAFLRPA